MSEWIPITMRPMTAEEIEHHVILNCTDDGMILTCPIPEDGQEVLITIEGEVLMDTFCQDIEGCYFDTYEIECISAWMPLPKPYEPKESDRKCHTCKHYTSGEHDGSCGSYICKGYSNWESEDKEMDEIDFIQPKKIVGKLISVEVLDKIRAELHATAEMHEDGDYYLREEWIDEIIDEYRGDVDEN